jgi:outer membrane lipoprotein carrier protein
MKFLKWLVLFLAFSSAAHATASATNLANLLNSVQTMQASFIQTIFDNHNKPIQASYGRMALQRPGKFRWEVTKPIPQLIVANGTKLWIYDKDLEQVTIRPLQKAVGDAPALLLSHVSADLDKTYTITELPSKTSNARSFMLTTKKSDDIFTSVRMEFLNNQISEMRLQDNLGHTTQIRYRDIKTNNTLSAALFNFKPPAGVDVIDETRKR